METLRFVDAHVHLWDLSQLRYPWLTPPFPDDGPNGSVAPIARTYLLDDYLADMAAVPGIEVAGMVHVDAGAEGAAALDETRWLQGIHDARGLPSGIVAFADLTDPAVDDLLAAHAAHSAVRGIRHIVNWHDQPTRTYTPRDLTRDPAWERGYARLAGHGLSFDLQAYPGQFAHLAALVARYPDVPVMINHAGMLVPSDAGGWDAWESGLAALAALPHVAIKLSGVGFAYRPWSQEQLRAYFLRAIELFGTDRAMIASDVPTDKLFGSVPQHLAAYRAVTDAFTADEQRALWGGNANRLYRLGLVL